MARRQDGPGGYQTFFPLGHRKKKDDVVRVDILAAEDMDDLKRAFVQANKRRAQEKRAQSSDRTRSRATLRRLFGDDEKVIKQVSEALSPVGCDDLVAWVASLRRGDLGALPNSLDAVFKMPVRKITEQNFDLWLCEDCKGENDEAASRLRRAAYQHLLAKSQQHFLNPHQEVLGFVSDLPPFLLYEIAYTAYQPSAISRLSQVLRRNGRLREG